MNYGTWRKQVFAARWTMAQLRCDVPPSQEMLDFMEEVGLDYWQKFVQRLQRDADGNLSRIAFGKEYR